MKHNQQRWGCIYKLTNKVNKKIYFGKTIHFKKRMSEHRRSAKKGKTYFARAIKKHGWSNFKVEIMIDEVPELDLDHLERSYIEIYDSMNRKTGYNLTKGGDGISGFVQSEEQRKNASKRLKMRQSNRDQFGTISYMKSRKAYQVFGPKDGNCKGTYIGQYDTRKHAKNALEIYNKTGKKTASTRTGHMRKKGSGAIRERFSRFQASYKTKYLGSFTTKEAAEAAVNHFIQTGEKLKSRRKGYIRKRKSRFEASYSRKYIGTYSSEQEAEEAIKKHLSTAHKATASTTTSV